MAQENNAAQPTPEQAREARLAKLPDAIRNGLELRALQRTTVAELMKTNWGANLDRSTVVAVADWALRHGIDATQEVDVLGGRIYLNARFYLRGLAYLIDAGRVEYVTCEHVEADPRLEAYPEEKKRREQLRIEHGLPDAAVSAVVARVKLKGVPHEFAGAQWAGGRGKREGGKLKDPIGEERPTETAETRALRRCLRLMVTHLPEQARERERIIDSAEVELTEKLQTATAQARRDIEHASRPPALLPSMSGYDEVPARQLKPGEVEMAVAAPRTPATHAVADRAATEIESPLE